VEDGCIGAPDERGAEGEVGEDSGCHFVVLVVELRWWGRLLSGVKLGRCLGVFDRGGLAQVIIRYHFRWTRSPFDVCSTDGDRRCISNLQCRYYPDSLTVVVFIVTIHKPCAQPSRSLTRKPIQQCTETRRNK
jgi:hypothetical protein